MDRVTFPNGYVRRAKKLASSSRIGQLNDQLRKPVSSCEDPSDITAHPDKQAGEPKVPSLIIALVDEYDFTRSCVASCLHALGRHIVVKSFGSIDECLAAEPRTFDLAFCYLHAALDLNVVGALSRLNRGLAPIPVMVVSDVDTGDATMEALAAGARGYLPAANTNLDVAVEVMRVVRAGGVFAPVSSALMEFARTRARTQASSPPDQFTPRQTAVLERMLKGDANKVIAHELSMSESTVKVHVRNIMKKMKATNRVQAVFRAYNFSNSDQASKTKPMPTATD